MPYSNKNMGKAAIINIVLALFSITCKAVNDSTIVYFLQPNGVEYETLFQSKDIRGTYCLRQGPSTDMYIIKNGLCMQYSDSTQPAIAFPPDFTLNDIYWIDNKICFFSDSSSIYFVTPKMETPDVLLSTDMSELQFRPGSKGIYYYQNKDNKLFFFPFENESPRLINEFDDVINDVKVENGSTCYIAFGDKIAMLTADNTFVPIFKASEKITAVEVGIKDEVYFGTEHSLFYIDALANHFEITNQGVKQLLFNNGILYVIHTDNSAVCIKNTLRFNQLSDSIVASRNESLFTSKNYKIECINDSKDNDLSDISCGVISGQGLYGIIGNELIGLDVEKNKIIEGISLPADKYVDQFVFTNDGLLLKTDSVLWGIQTDGAITTYFIENGQFNIDYKNNSTITILYENSIFEYIPSTQDLNLIETIPSSIIVKYFEINNDTKLLILDNGIYLKQNSEFQTLLNFPVQIVTADVSVCGIFFGTKKGLYEYIEPGKIKCLMEKPVKQILSDGNSVYIVTENGDIYRIQKG